MTRHTIAPIARLRKLDELLAMLLRDDRRQQAATGDKIYA
jgi:hypothetical protein